MFIFGHNNAKYSANILKIYYKQPRFYNFTDAFCVPYVIYC